MSSYWMFVLWSIVICMRELVHDPTKPSYLYLQPKLEAQKSKCERTAQDSSLGFGVQMSNQRQYGQNPAGKESHPLTLYSFFLPVVVGRSTQSKKDKNHDHAPGIWLM